MIRRIKQSNRGRAGDRRRRRRQRRRHEVDETNRRIPRSDSPAVQPARPFLPLYHSVNRGDMKGHKVRGLLDLNEFDASIGV
jgi:hypothetical protein